MVTSHKWPFISYFRTEMPYKIPVPTFSLTYAMGDLIWTFCITQYSVCMSGRVRVAVSLLAGILEKPGWILDGDMEYATCFFFIFLSQYKYRDLQVSDQDGFLL